jgi:hypothetical protein
MGGLSVFEKIKAHRRMLDAAMGADEKPLAVAPQPPPKVKGTKRVPTRDQSTGKIIWVDVPED